MTKALLSVYWHQLVRTRLSVVRAKKGTVDQTPSLLIHHSSRFDQCWPHLQISSNDLLHVAFRTKLRFPTSRDNLRERIGVCHGSRESRTQTLKNPRRGTSARKQTNPPC